MNGIKKENGLGDITFNQLTCISSRSDRTVPVLQGKLSSEIKGIINEDEQETWVMWHKPGDCIEDEDIQSHHSWKHVLARVKKSKATVVNGWLHE